MSHSSKPNRWSGRTLWFILLFFFLLSRRHDDDSSFLGDAFVIMTTPTNTRRQRRNNKSSLSYSTTTTTTTTAATKTTTTIPTGCTVQLKEPQTGVEVILIGCFHGSNSSAVDVQQTLQRQNNNNNDDDDTIVVMELCAGRFADLRQSMLLDETTTNTETAIVSSSSNNNNNSFDTFVKTVSSTFYKKGLSSATATAVLGTVSTLQTALSGLQPGLEFSTALRMAAAAEYDIVLADQAVQETIHRLGQLPQTSWGMWRNLLHVKQWDQSSFGKEATALGRALLGDTTLRRQQQQQVTLPGFLTRNREAVQDLIRLLTPQLLLLPVLTAILSLLLSFFVMGDAHAATTTTSSVAIDHGAPPVVALLSNAFFIGLNYLSLALPATKIILSERDEQLTRGIQSACAMAAERPGPCRVVAVLGFLHVNGIAERLLMNDERIEGSKHEFSSTR